MSSSTPLKSSQGSNLDHTDFSTNAKGSILTDDDIDDTKILTRTSGDESTAMTDGELEDTKIIAERSTEEVSNAEENNSKAELANGGESDDEDDEVIPSSQDSGALSPGGPIF